MLTYEDALVQVVPLHQLEDLVPCCETVDAGSLTDSHRRQPYRKDPARKIQGILHDVVMTTPSHILNSKRSSPGTWERSILMRSWSEQKAVAHHVWLRRIARSHLMPRYKQGCFSRLRHLEFGGLGFNALLVMYMYTATRAYI